MKKAFDVVVENRSEKNHSVSLINALISSSVGDFPCPSKKVISNSAEKERFFGWLSSPQLPLPLLPELLGMTGGAVPAMAWSGTSPSRKVELPGVCCCVVESTVGGLVSLGINGGAVPVIVSLEVCVGAGIVWLMGFGALNGGGNVEFPTGEEVAFSLGDGVPGAVVELLVGAVVEFATGGMVVLGLVGIKVDGLIVPPGFLVPVSSEVPTGTLSVTLSFGGTVVMGTLEELGAIVGVAVAFVVKSDDGARVGAGDTVGGSVPMHSLSCS